MYHRNKNCFAEVLIKKCVILRKGDEKMFRVSVLEILCRLGLVILTSGIIGFDREQKNRPAGMRTHILVGIGACIIAMMQQEIAAQAVIFAKSNPQIATVIRADQARLIAQVVSGIGFLGAGTIVVTHHSIRGLTTAASLWATAGLGLAIGMGYYAIALLSFIAVIAVLVLLKKIVHVPTNKNFQIKYVNPDEVEPFIQEFFKSRNIKAITTDYAVDTQDEVKIFRKNYAIAFISADTSAEIIDGLAQNKNIIAVRALAK